MSSSQLSRIAILHGVPLEREICFIFLKYIAINLHNKHKIIMIAINAKKMYQYRRSIALISSELDCIHPKATRNL